MSVESAVNFFGKMAEDDQLRTEVEKLIADKKNTESDQTVAEFAGGRGFEFTADECFQARAAVKQHLIEKGKIQEELDERELAAITGGATPINIPSPSATPINVPSPSSVGALPLPLPEPILVSSTSLWGVLSGW